MNTPSYYILPDIRAYKESEGAERQRLARRIATVIDDPAVLRAILEVAPAEFADFYPDDTPQLSTLDTIDSFLDQFGGKTPGAQSDELVIAPAIDYAAQVLDAPQPSSPGADAPETKEPAAQKPAAPVPQKPAAAQPTKPSGAPAQIGADLGSEAPSEPALSLSLVKIVVKKHNYRKAFEIIEAMSLNNPEKSVYFADQMRYLKKLMALSELRH